MGERERERIKGGDKRNGERARARALKRRKSPSGVDGVGKTDTRDWSRSFLLFVQRWGGKKYTFIG